MALPSGRTDREVGKFVEDASGNVAVRTINPYARYGLLTRKTIEFNGTAGNGGIGTVNLFSVTGDVLIFLLAVCSEDLEGAGSIQVGIAGNTAGLLAQIADATTIDEGEIWTDGSLSSSSLTNLGATNSTGDIIAAGSDIIATIGSNAITNGTLTFYALYTPLSSDGNITPA